MERFSHRESVLLGYSPQRFANHSSSSPKSPNRNSDFDFNDVFGGPPRRSSIQEVRFSLADTRDPNAMRSDDDTVSSGHRWSGLDEKPVFGDDGVNRRCTSDNFFNDIFGGNNSLSSSPRKHDRDPFSYSPRVLSPVRPLPPRAEPLGSSLPAQFSLPTKLIKGPELPTFGSSARNHHRNKDGAPNGTSHYSNSPLSRSSSPANLVQEELGNDVYRQGSLSKELSVGSEDFIIPDETDKDNNLKRDLKTSEVPANGSRFHFSIYRWASKGAPLATPLRRGSSKFREKYLFEKSASASGRMASESLTRELQAATSEYDNFSSLNREPPQLVENAVHPGIRLSGNTVEESEPHSYPDSDFSEKPKEEITSAAKDVSKTELKTLYSLFFDNDYKQDVDDTSRKNGVKENKTKSTRKASAVYGVNGNGKKQEGQRTTLKPEEVDKANLQDSPTRDNLRKNKLSGRVKDFVKIFNQEDSEKPKSEADSRTRHSRTKEKGQLRATDEAGVDTIKINEANRLSNGNKNDKPDASFMVDDYLKQSTKQHPETRTSTCKSSDIACGLKDNAASARATVPDGSNAAFEDLKQSFQGNFVVKELVLDADKQPQTSGNHEEIQAIDAKIRKWSNGKEGNIRSLLSTLQYVLWPESGWKPVPLVDIIEASAVRRSYNKALLYLHPDKLLQKGATSHQKYTAEKVFDILQEAWTHFNSLGSV